MPAGRQTVVGIADDDDGRRCLGEAPVERLGLAETLRAGPAPGRRRAPPPPRSRDPRRPPPGSRASPGTRLPGGRRPWPRSPRPRGTPAPQRSGRVRLPLSSAEEPPGPSRTTPGCARPARPDRGRDPKPPPPPARPPAGSSPGAAGSLPHVLRVLRPRGSAWFRPPWSRRRQRQCAPSSSESRAVVPTGCLTAK